MSVALAYLLLAMDQSGCVYVKHECTKQPALLPALAPEGGRIRVTAEIDTFWDNGWLGGVAVASADEPEVLRTTRKVPDHHRSPKIYLVFFPFATIVNNATAPQNKSSKKKKKKKKTVYNNSTKWMNDTVGCAQGRNILSNHPRPPTSFGYWDISNLSGSLHLPGKDAGHKAQGGTSGGNPFKPHSTQTCEE
ncbi:hypothetical protein GX48_04566 [Paracoccidioides brasiliensis]|nr:hypothetical protein GX48_04566 [Paracoccidioides brasiliensis]